jgi:hypothetical protein
MKGKTLVKPLALGLLTLMMLTMPVLAQYNVTLTLWGPTGEELYTTTFEDVDNMTLTVPEPLWILINATQGTTTFTAPFSVPFFIIGKGILTLEATSVPEGWTVTFEPMEMPDLNGDGEVDIFDLVRVARSIEVIVGPPENYEMFLDLTFDLTIDVFDLVEVAKHIEITI